MGNLIIPGRVWVFLPSLANVIGVVEAVIVQQLFYLLNDLGVDEIEWSWSDWEDVYGFIKPRTLRRRVDGLVEIGVIRRIDREGRAPLISIDIPKLYELARINPGQSGQGGVQNGQSHPGQSGQGDYIIRYIINKYIYPLSGENENELLERLKLQNPSQLVVTWWNMVAKDHGFVLCTTDNFHRADRVAAAIENGFLDNLAKIEKALKENPWYSGKNDQGWIVSLDWLLQDGKIDQVLGFAAREIRRRSFSYSEALKHYESKKGRTAGFPGDMFEFDKNTGLWNLNS